MTVAFGDNRLPERFWAKAMQRRSGCWEWSATRTEKGYGMFWVDGRLRRAHRISYMELVGEIQTGLQLDHLCRTRGCVNPAHLEPVTCKENLRRGLHFSREKTHCPRGHKYNAQNTRITKEGWRACRRCRQLRHQRSMRQTGGEG